MHLPTKVTIKEVGPRDGLQNESKFIETQDKVDWINLLSKTGLDYIEVSSFVHPKWIPQLADSEQVLKSINREKGVTYAALVPNIRGLERALTCNVNEVSVFMSASEGHNKSNINKTIDETFPVLKEVVDEALKANVKVRGYVSTVIACPYDGPVSPEQVLKVVDRLAEMGVYEISLGDTIGVGVPTQVESLLSTLLKHFPSNLFAMHFHDTRGTALANVVKSLEMGITTFDSSTGGLGGCPYAKGASGNVSTEDLLYMLSAMNIETGVNQEALMKLQEMKGALTLTTLVQFNEIEKGIGLITLNRPEAANAMSIQLLTDLNECLDEVAKNREIRVVLITGSGDKAFCAGADLKERKNMNEQQVRETVRLIGSTVNRVEALPQPVIAVLNGVAFGGGLELALACDLRIASSEAKMGLTEVSLGIIPGAGGTQRLPRLIGLGKAKELIYTARRITASEALEINLINEVVEKEDLLKRATELAREIAKNAPLSLIQAKIAINKGIEVDLTTGLKIEELAYNELLYTEDRMEGLVAFQEKRQPQYVGR